MKGGKLIPKSVLKSGIKLPDIVNKTKMPVDSYKSAGARGSTSPENDLETVSSITGSLIVKKDQNEEDPSAMVKHKIELEITCEKKMKKKSKDENEKAVPDARELVRHELNAVLKGSSESTVLPRKILKDPSGTQRIVSFSGTVQLDNQVEEKEVEEEITPIPVEEIEESVVDGPAKEALNPDQKSGLATASLINCQKCCNKVYPLEKLEPSAGQFYHEHCFRCAVCNTKLSLVTYCKNLEMTKDPKVYCRPHQPRINKVLLICIKPLRLSRHAGMEGER